ncbi:hypothetical protein [Marinilabilia rubra]|uniref:DUF4369 domain-containing protein n=1 Tax=Marinilabilia rubra TaxID=2162893 RepID=A0A2U2BBW9_9BACT|nr:hypothetical protein [Marinilabilia rubra]PWE00527.1 hypothetical protein DDZ16_06265 [Marinilabilia rubra]
MNKKTPILLSVAGTLLSAAAFAFFRLRNRAEKTPFFEKSPKRSPAKPNIPASTLYKTKGIKKVEIKAYHDIKLSGFFRGEAKVRPDEHDKYNVDIFVNDNDLIGHIEKNRRLSNSITVWHNGAVFAFGLIPTSGDVDNSQQKTFAFIPVGLSDNATEEILTALRKLEDREKILEKEEIASNDYLQILNDHQLVSEVFKKYDLLNEFDISLSKKLIPALSKQLEEEEDWEGLLKLEKHASLIDELSERFAGATYRRISKARKTKGIKQ